MLSILIPNYNYNLLELVTKLKTQAEKAKINFEIIIGDDASTIYQEQNLEINNLKNCRVIINKKNKGRTDNRNNLAINAKFSSLLFLDSDVLPESDNFILNYINQIEKLKDTVIFGGYKYLDIAPDFSKILRYTYGKSREEKSAYIRNKTPYSFVFSGNMLINKRMFLDNNVKNINMYGLDNFFSYNFFINKIKIIHIENPIIHLGLENNDIFFKKSLESVLIRKKNLSNKKNVSKINRLIFYYIFLKRIGLKQPISIIFNLFEKKLKNKIICNKPNLLLFDLYRLGYICHLKD